jgi:hypothetical protein
MPKKLFALFVVGILMLSACQGGTDDATATEATTIKTDITATEEGAEPSTEVVVEGEQMPCSPLFDYETTEEADSYQAVVDQLRLSLRTIGSLAILTPRLLSWNMRISSVQLARGSLYM